MTRGRRDWLDLQRTELASAATCRSPGAQRRLEPGRLPSASRTGRTALRCLTGAKNTRCFKGVWRLGWEPRRPVMAPNVLSSAPFLQNLGTTPV